MTSYWTYYALFFLAVEKTVQHVVVTLAFYFNWGEIASTVVVAPAVLMVSGALIAVLFAISVWGLFKKQVWTIDLLVFLAVFDLVGEFVAQGRLDIVMTISFLVAALLLLFSLIYRRQVRRA